MIKYVNKNFVNFIHNPPHPAFNFKAMKWRWTNFQMQVALTTLNMNRTLVLNELKN